MFKINKNSLHLSANVFSTAVLIGGTVTTETSVSRIPTGGRLTTWLFTSVGEELKRGIAVLQIQSVVRAGIEPGISDSKCGVLTTRPRCLPQRER